MQELHIPEPPKDIFIHQGITPENQVTQEPRDVFFIEKIEYPESGGIQVYKFGGELKATDKKGEYEIINRVPLLYPEKGFPTPQAIHANNYVKRMFVTQLSFLSQKEILICFLPLLLLPWKRKVRILERLLYEFQRIAYVFFVPFYMKDRYMHPLTRELAKLTKQFLLNLGVSTIVSAEFANSLATMIEYDSAYLYRLEDILSETNVSALKQNIRKEIERMIQLVVKRDGHQNASTKFLVIGKVLSLVFLSRKIRKAFFQALDTIDFTQMQYDDADRYHVMYLQGYEWFGESYESRITRYVNMHNGNPPKTIRIAPPT